MASETDPILGPGTSASQEIANSDPDLHVSVNRPKSNSTVVFTDYRPYKSRWYVLFIFVLLATSQLCLWNTWGPIADTGENQI